MEADRLKILFEKYYTGDILPHEYQYLLSALKESDELAPELDAERRMLLAIESCEAAEPEGLEDRLVMAINNRSKRRRNFLRMVYSGSAAAIVMVVMTIGMHIHDNNSIDDLESIANISVATNACVANETLETESSANATQVKSVTRGISISHPDSSKDLAKSFQIADEALLDVLANIYLAQTEAIDAMENIEISQTTDYNIL